jgi:RimJ/RimL family protein N-acetyltransferase
MRWPSIKLLRKNVAVPQDFSLDQLQKTEIRTMMRKLIQWYPGFKVGSETCFLDKRYYKKQIYLKNGNDKRDTIIVVLKHFKKIIGFYCACREVGAKNVYAKMMVIDPEYRGQGFIDIGPEIAEYIARYMNAKILYCMATLQHPHSQHAIEKAGYQLCGILPSFNIELLDGNVRKRVYEAIYVKMLCPEKDNLKPNDLDLIPSTKKLYDFLFEGKSELPAIESPKVQLRLAR